LVARAVLFNFFVCVIRVPPHASSVI